MTSPFEHTLRPITFTLGLVEAFRCKTISNFAFASSSRLEILLFRRFIYRPIGGNIDNP